MRAAPIESVRSSPYPDRFPDLIASVYIRDQYTHARTHPENKPDRFGRFRAPRKNRAIDRLDFSIGSIFSSGSKIEIPHPDSREDLRADRYAQFSWFGKRANPKPDRSGRFRATRKNRAIDRLDFRSIFARFFSSGSKIEIPDPDSHEI